MRFAPLLLVGASFANAAIIPEYISRRNPLPLALDLPELIPDGVFDLVARHWDAYVSGDVNSHELEKWRGGGGGRGGGSSGSSGGSSSGGTSSGGGRPGTGTTGGGARGTSATPSLAGGTRYAGGATSPYRPGSPSPSGITPRLLGAGALGFLGGSLLASSLYLYPYTYHYPHHNDTTNRNDSLPVDCFCDPYSNCGCDNPDSNSTIDQMLQNSSIAKIQDVDGTQTVVINGTLPNDTSSGDDGSDSSGGDTPGAASGFGVFDAWGVWVVVGIAAVLAW